MHGKDTANFLNEELHGGLFFTRWRWINGNKNANRVVFGWLKKGFRVMDLAMVRETAVSFSPVWLFVLKCSRERGLFPCGNGECAKNAEKRMEKSWKLFENDRKLFEKISFVFEFVFGENINGQIEKRIKGKKIQRGGEKAMILLLLFQ